MNPTEISSSFIVDPSIAIGSIPAITEQNLSQMLVPDYDIGGWFPIHDPSTAHNHPPFSVHRIRDMLSDPKICYALSLIKGPIHTSTLFLTQVESEDPSVAQMVVETDIDFVYVIDSGNEQIDKYMVTTLERFWQNGLFKLLTAVEWGYAGCEVVYTQRKTPDGSDGLDLENLKTFRPEDIQPVILRGELVGMTIMNSPRFSSADSIKYIGIPKAIWHVQRREVHPFFGGSRCQGAYLPWWEIWSRGGARDVRRNWFYKNSYDGGTMYYKPGSTIQAVGGAPIPNKQLALNMLSTSRAGGYRVFASEYDPVSGKPYWAYEAPSANATPQGLLEYLDTLGDEELEGMGIPPEVVQSAGSDGMGSATGRKIPLLAFRSTLRGVADAVLTDVVTQVMTPILFFRFGYRDRVTLRPYRPKMAYDISQDIDLINAKNAGNPSNNPKDLDAVDNGTGN
jgi:hypothetical protein